MQMIVTGTFTVVIDSALSFTANPNMPQGSTGAAYPPTSVGTVSGGIGPYTFSNAQGLPAGMTLSAAGILSGTPTGPNGVYNPTFTITDSTP